MARTLHCSKNFNNFNICLDHKVAGFTHRGQNSGDLIYLLVKQGKTLAENPRVPDVMGKIYQKHNLQNSKFICFVRISSYY